MLEKDPSKRPTAEQCLQHPWISGDAASRKALVGTIRTMEAYNTIRRAPGATMRHKEAGSKNPVMNIFSMGAPSPRAPTSLLNVDPFPQRMPTLDVPEDGKKRKGSKTSADKKERRKSAQPKRKDDSPSAAPAKGSGFALSIGEASTRDMIKKLEELRVSSPTAASAAAASSGKSEATSKELTKMKEMYLSEKSRRIELGEQLETASEAQQAAEDAANKLAAELIESKKLCEKLEAQWEDEKVQTYDLKKERTALQDQVKVSAREVKEAVAASERDKRRAAEAEKLKDDTAQKLVDLSAKFNHLSTSVKIETIVADRLESKRIKELEARVEELEAKLKSASQPNGH